MYVCIYVSIYVCLYVCILYVSVFQGMYVLPCADDVQLGLSEGFGQPTHDWSQWTGEDATMPSSESTPPSSIKQVEKLLKYIVLIFELRCFHPLSINNLARKKEHPWTN